MNVPVAAFAFFMATRILEESRSDMPEPTPDLLGIPLLIAAIGALALGIVQTDEWGWTDTRTLAAFGVATVVGAIFIWRSATQPSPTLDLKLFRERNFRYANIAPSRSPSPSPRCSSASCRSSSRSGTTRFSRPDSRSGRGR